MRRSLAAIAALLLVTTATPSHAIVNGTQITDASWKFLVAVGCSRTATADDCHNRHFGADGLGMFSPQFCGGVLIRPRIVATAAHCMVQSNGSFFTPSDILVGGGSPVLGAMTRDQDVAAVEAIVVNPSYDKTKQTGDLALLVLQQEIANSATITFVTSNGSVPEAVTAEIAGWGDIDGSGTAPMAANYARITLYPQEQCAASLGSDFDAATMLCGGAKDAVGWIDACQGDSGGPLLATINNERTLIGLTSWGTACAKGNPGIYTRIGGLLPTLLADVLARFPVDLDSPPAAPVLKSATRITRGGMVKLRFLLQTDGQVVNKRTIACTRSGQKIVASTSGLTITVKKLRYGKRYTCRAQAWNLRGTSSWSKPFVLR